MKTSNISGGLKAFFKAREAERNRALVQEKIIQDKNELQHEEIAKEIEVIVVAPEIESSMVTIIPEPEIYPVLVEEPEVIEESVEEEIVEELVPVEKHIFINNKKKKKKKKSTAAS